ncbi:MAG TPA: hypothetical protein VNG53_03900 [Bacteroidia bacterium]|nr:hypothetical protein [Bacteroidia bacterium]
MSFSPLPNFRCGQISFLLLFFVTLKEKYGNGYDDYAKKTKMLIPFIL